MAAPLRALVSACGSNGGLSFSKFQSVFVACALTTQSNASLPELATTTKGKVQRISRAMQAYLERAEAHDKMMAEHTAEFEMGKRHLARMMDADPENFHQEDVDQAIEYLLPSGLFSRRARPKMKHPEKIFPKRKAAEFDITGRPYHYLFYTGLPNYYDLMHTVGIKLANLENMESKYKPAKTLCQHKFLDGTEWIDAKALEALLLEKVDDHMYKRFVTLMSRLAEHYLAQSEQDFLMKYRCSLVAAGQMVALPTPVTDAISGRRYVETEGRRKQSRSKVKVWENGSGLVNINGSDITYFKGMAEREQIMSPLVFVQKLGRVDFEASVEFGGCSSQAGAIRLALSLGLAAFEDKNMQETMRQAGLITMDPRRKERMKPGQRGAREKKTWKKR